MNRLSPTARNLFFACLAIAFSACGGGGGGGGGETSDTGSASQSESHAGTEPGTEPGSDSDTTSATESPSSSSEETDSGEPTSSDTTSHGGTSDSNTVDTADPSSDTGDTATGTQSEDTAATDSESESHTQFENYPDNFDRYTVDDTRKGPSFVSIGDVTGDDIADLVVSYFGSSSVFENLTMKGYAVLYSTTGEDLASWEADVVVNEDEQLHFVNAISLVDVDSDEDLDLFVPSGFLAGASNPLVGDCGGIDWYENDGGDWLRHRIVHDNDLFYHHVEIADLDGDGLDDFITVGEKKPIIGSSVAEVQLFLGVDDEDRFAKTPQVLGNGLGSIPRFIDLDGDSDLDIASAEYFHNNSEGVSFAWFEQVNKPTAGDPSGAWERHVIASDLGPSIQLSFIDDLFGDGELRAVGTNHTNTEDDGDAPESQVVVFEDLPTDPETTPWPYRKISEGIVSRESPLVAPQGAPGVFGQGDIDGDGDIDLAISGDGDNRVFVLEQTAPGVFATRVLAEGLGQCGVSDIVDIDGDGHAELAVTSYEANVVYLYRWKL